MSCKNVIHKNDKLKYVHCITIIRLNDLAESVRALYDFKDDICVLDFQNICYKYYGPFYRKATGNLLLSDSILW